MGRIERSTEADVVLDLAAVLERVRTQGMTFDIVRGADVVARLESPAVKDRQNSTDKACSFEQLPAYRLSHSHWSRPAYIVASRTTSSPAALP
jgi:hypothetical protein